MNFDNLFLLSNGNNGIRNETTLNIQHQVGKNLLTLLKRRLAYPLYRNKFYENTPPYKFADQTIYFPEIIKKLQITRYAVTNQCKNIIYPKLKLEFNQSSVSIYKKAKILAPYGFAYSNNNHLICPPNQNYHVLFDTYPVKQCAYIKTPRKAKKLNSIFYFLGPNVLNYYHFLTDRIPSLMEFFEYAKNYDENCKIALYKDTPATFIQALLKFGVREDQYVLWNKKEDPALKVDTLVMPSSTKDIYLSSYLHNDRVKWMRGKIRPASRDNSNANLKLFVSRKDVNQTRVTNHDSLEHLLKNYGFRTVHLTSLTFDEQIELFLKASTIVGAHGAGLTNTLFCNNEASIIEISPNKFMGSYYANIAQQINANYLLYLIPENRNNRIDIDKFEKFLSNKEISND